MQPSPRLVAIIVTTMAFCLLVQLIFHYAIKKKLVETRDGIDIMIDKMVDNEDRRKPKKKKKPSKSKKKYHHTRFKGYEYNNNYSYPKTFPKNKYNTIYSGQFEPEGTESSYTIFLFKETHCKGENISISPRDDLNFCTKCFDTCSGQSLYDDGSKTQDNVRSMQVSLEDVNPAFQISVYDVCSGTYDYGPIKPISIIRPQDGCVSFSTSTNNMFQIQSSSQKKEKSKSYHIIYSSEATQYFRWQAFANIYAFEQTHHPRLTGYTRLLSASVYDDIAKQKGGPIPTFLAPKSNDISKFYAPYNKADAFNQFMTSQAHSPKEDVIVVVDPDNWLMTGLGHFTAKVRRGAGVAAPAFYNGNTMLTKLYREPGICEHACMTVPDTVGVPYLIHREDAKKIAPRWPVYIEKLQNLFKNKTIEIVYKSLQPNWCIEMYAFNFAAAEVGVVFKKNPLLQLRDTGNKITHDTWIHMPNPVAMIHVGRAWFPAEYAKKYTPQWIHTEGGNLKPKGTEQVWCKCNFSNHTFPFRPWPLPSNIDFVSNVTLTVLHESGRKYGI